MEHTQYGSNVMKNFFNHMSAEKYTVDWKHSSYGKHWLHAQNIVGEHRLECCHSKGK